MAPDGTVLVVYDLAPFPIFEPSGVTFGPASHDPALTSIYITDRGVDEGADPDENDGAVYEFDVGATPPIPSAVYMPVMASW